MRLELLRGATGMCITLDGTRITEPKIYGTMTPIQVWSVDADSIAEIIGCERVRRGQWVKGYCKDEEMNCVFCSACGKSAYWDTDYGQQRFPYCPYCGAKMDLRTPTEVQLDEADSVMMGEAEQNATD